MGVVTFPARMVDGPLSPLGKSEIVRLMADELIKYDAWRNSADAWRCLMVRGFKSFDIARNIDDVRQVAMQEAVVAEEMARP